MKSFADRADRGVFSLAAIDSLSPPDKAFRYQQLGHIDLACEVYQSIYVKTLAASTSSTSSTTSDIVDAHTIDAATADYCQLLEICCRHTEAVQILRTTLVQHPLPCPTLCSVLLLKILFTHPLSRTSYCWHEIKHLLVQFDTASSVDKKKFKKMYKSHYAYYTIVQQLFIRERRLYRQLQLIQHVDQKEEAGGEDRVGRGSSTNTFGYGKAPVTSTKTKGRGRGPTVANIVTTTSTLPTRSEKP